MSKGSDGDKTEDPTPKRKRDARKDGQIPKSSEIGSWSAMLIATYLLQLTAMLAADRTTAMFTDAMEVVEQPEVGPALSLLGDSLVSGVVILTPLAVGLLLLGVVVNLLQVGWNPSGKLLKPKLERVNVFKGLKRLLSPNSMWEGGKTLIKVIVLGGLAYRAIADIVPVLVAGGRQSIGASVALIGERSLSLTRSVAFAGLVLAFVDYLLQRKRIAKSMRMTKQEVRDEHKQADGDPQMKGAIRSKQLSMSRNRMMAEVASADVVLVNPTHVAVALKYDPSTGAPRVVAKGAGEVARRIREEADRAEVPLVADIPLARAVFRACDLGQEIPPDLYDAVARVLAFVFALSRRGSAGGLHRVPGLLAGV